MSIKHVGQKKNQSFIKKKNEKIKNRIISISGREKNQTKTVASKKFEGVLNKKKLIWVPGGSRRVKL